MVPGTRLVAGSAVDSFAHLIRAELLYWISFLDAGDHRHPLPPEAWLPVTDAMSGIYSGSGPRQQR